jgi:hypothetical protein
MLSTAYSVSSEQAFVGWDATTSGHFLRIRQWGGHLQKGPYYTKCGEMIDGCWLQKVWCDIVFISKGV